MAKYEFRKIIHLRNSSRESPNILSALMPAKIPARPPIKNPAIPPTIPPMSLPNRLLESLPFLQQAAREHNCCPE
jgi:hypothetical protein